MDTSDDARPCIGVQESFAPQSRAHQTGPRPARGHMPFKGHRTVAEWDNLLARAKQGVDALAEVLGVNDQIFEFTLRRGDPVKGGRVIVTIARPRLELEASEME